MTDSETIKANFPFPIIPREPGLPDFQKINEIHGKGKTNASSVSSTLGGGTWLARSRVDPRNLPTNHGKYICTAGQPRTITAKRSRNECTNGGNCTAAQRRITGVPSGNGYRLSPEITVTGCIQRHVLPGITWQTYRLYRHNIHANDHTHVH